MNIKLTIFNRLVTRGYDYSRNVKDIVYTTNRKGCASTFEFDVIGLNDKIECGYWVLCEIDGKRIFRGYIFKISKDKTGVAKILAYDQLRYLKTNHSYSFIGMSVDEIVKKIATDFILAVGNLSVVPYKIPSLICEDTTLFDMIDEALTQTLNNTGLIYVLYDDFGELTLKQASEMQKNKIVGDMSASNYTYTLDIDKETYNQVRLVRANKNTGKADVVIVNDSSTINKWGLLQYYEKIDENANEAQMQQTAETRLKYYNRVLETITFENVIGDFDVRAGVMIPIKIEKLSKFQSPYWLICDKVTHKVNGNIHMMDINCNILSNVFYQ